MGACFVFQVNIENKTRPQWWRVLFMGPYISTKDAFTTKHAPTEVRPRRGRVLLTPIKTPLRDKQ